MSAIDQYKQKIHKLEHELDDMTAALSHAWDQLVPFLQDAPAQVETSHDLVPILHAVNAAADTEVAGIYLFEAAEWHSVPDHVTVTADFVHMLASITEQQLVECRLETGQTVN